MIATLLDSMPAVHAALLAVADPSAEASTSYVWIWGLVAGLAGGIGAHWFISRRILGAARESASGQTREAQKRAETLLAKARAEVQRDQTAWTAELARECEEVEDGLSELTTALDDRDRELERREEELAGRSEGVEELKRELRQLKTQRRRLDRELRDRIDEEKDCLLERAGLTEERAREMQLGQIESEVEREQQNRFARHAEILDDDLEKIARRIIAIGIARCDIKHEDINQTGAVTLPNPAFKERFVGPEGENQRVFEELTGVNLLFDETEPLNVVLSAFDGMRKAIARRTIEKLISHNAPIEPDKIKDFVEKSTREMKRLVLDAGKKVCSQLKLKGVNPEIQSLLGRLNYRTSYGQNVLKHSKEVAFLAATIAAEMGIDQKLAKRCGLLHDIGKAVDAEIEGGHPEIGAEIASRCSEEQAVLDAIALHHEDPDGNTTYTLLTQSGDAVSGSRPGARRETLERYLKHLEDLEAIGQGAKGVETAYAIQAGRELRVFVDPKSVSDEDAFEICKSITSRVEEELTYPGKIRVTVVREMKTNAYAR